MTTTQPERQSDRETSLLTQKWYRNCVLGVLTLCDVINVIAAA